MPGETIVYLLRHAESAPDPALPEAGWPLSERGAAQAAALAPCLAALGIDRLYASPYRRALETVAPFARLAGLPVVVDDRLRERTLTDGWTPDFQSALARVWEDFAFAWPGGESSAQCQRRMQEAVDALAGQNTGRTLLLSSHGNAIALYLNGLDPAFGFAQWRAMTYPDLFRVRPGAARWERLPLVS